MTLSSLLSAALILLPVLPVSPAHAAAGTGRNNPSESADMLKAAPVAALAAAPLVPSLTATKTDSFDDPDGDGKAEPGQTITYNVTITNNGTDATNVQFTDTIDPNTTLVPGSVATQPIATNDSYNVLGNVRIQPNAAAGLLANDCDPDNGGPCSSAGLNATGPSTSAQGGNVAVNPDGSFSYNPPAGFEGIDSFNYTVTDASGKTDTATATFTVNEMVWFVDNAAAPGGDGRLTAPFNSLASVNGVGDPDEPFDVIYVLQGAGAYGGGIVLEDNQRLVGQGTGLDAALAGFGIVAPPHSDARPAATGAPTLANAGGDVIALANSNHVSFLNASAASPGAAAISSNGAGGSTTVDNVGASASGSSNGFSLVNHAGVLSVTSSSVSANSTGTGVLVNGGATAITFTNSTVSQNTGRVVDIQNRTGGAVSFNGSSTVTGTNGATDAIVLLGNTGGSTVNFAAAVQLNTTAPGARGLVADSTGGFTLNMTGGGSAVSSTGGAAVDIEDIAANVQIATTFSTDSNQNGVRVNNISGSASFGNTTVNNSSATGVSLTGNSASLTFSDLDIAPAANQRALHATSNTGAITSSSGTVLTTGAIAVEVQGTSAANRTPLNVQLTSVSASGGPNGIVLQNTSASGSPGGFRVNGIAGNCSPADPTCTGGRITATTGADNTDSGIGVRLQDAASVSLTRMRIDNHPNFAVSGTNVNGFTLDSSLVDGTNGGNAAFDEGSLRFRELTGSAAISNSFVGGGHEFIVDLRNTGSSSLDRLTISGSTVGDLDGAGPGFGVSALAGDDGLHFEHATGGGTFKVTVTGSTLNSGRGDIVNFNTAGTVTSDFVFRSNVTHNTHPAILAGGGGVTVTGGGIGSNINATYDISCNSFRGARGFGLLVAKTLGAGTMRGTLFGNVFGVDGTPGSSSTEASGINLDTRGAGTHTALVKNNVVNEWGSNGAIQVFNNQGSATMNVTLQGNVTNNPDPNLAFAALYAEVGALSGDTGTLNILVGGAGAAENNFVEGDPFDFSDVFLSRIAGAGTTLNLSRGVSAASNVQQIITDNNADPVFAADSGTINFVNTVPALPPAVDQTCSAPVASNAPVDSIFQTNANATQTASATATEPGFSADREFAASSKKVQRGFANSERGQLLGAGERETLPEVETPKTVRAAAPVTATLAGETVTIPIGTLRAGDSVTITFQVTVADPFTGAQPQVSNQGTVSADGGISVLTDDPSEPGAADPTVTPILLPPTININDATVTEPATGSASASFTVTLSHPFTQPVTVSFTTANGGANPATAGTDYTPTNGTVTFNAGETVQTVNVAALADGDAGEADETFLVNLSGATNGTIGDGQAVGTITDESVASAVIISELRTSGPAGSGDDFVELLNTTDADITVASSDASGGWSIVKSGVGCSTTPVVVGFIPNGTVIRARGNYLLTGSAYSLGGYATGDATLSADIEDDRNVGLFTTATLANVSSVNRLDAVGFGANTGDNCELLREGNNLPAAMGSTSEYSFVRKVTLGLTHDTGDNAADFAVVSTTPSMPVGDNSAPTLGAPGPENGASPTGPVPCAVPSSTPLFGRSLVDPTVAVASAPNTVRDATPVTNGTNGTLDFRRTFTNNTGGSVTRLRFRVVNLSTFPAGTGAADLRALTSGSTVVSTAGGPVTVQGTTLETPPAQASGGGVNSSLAAGTITLGSPLANGASISLRFLFGVEQVGDYNLAFVLEALPGPTGKDFWKLSGHTETGGHTDGGCNAPPVADAGLDQTLECAGATTPVTLDGSGSSDPDGDTPLTFDWSEGMTSLGSGETLNVNLASGSHTITLTVTDPSGASAQDTVVVNIIDTTAPVVNDPPDVTVSTGANASSCGAFVSDAALGTATATDGCEGALAVNRTGVPAGNIFPVGTTIVTYTATDAAGNTGSATQAVTVIDNTPPVVTPPANVVATADADSCSATLNPGTASVMDNCPGATVVGTRSDNQPLNAPYPVGTTTITWTGTDASGNTASATQTVTVQDNQTPTVTASVAVTTMGPPFNHAMINVGLAASASDNCPGLGPLQVSVFSDEDDGPGPHSPDALDLGLGTLKLRRERDGGSNGRVYLVVVKATDASGNTAASCQTVTVPLSSSAGDKAAVASQASAAAAFCSANNGAAPSGYFVVGP